MSKRPIAVLALLVLCSLAALACAPETADAPDDGEAATAELRALMDEVWERRLETEVWARMLTGRRVESLPDLSEEKARGDAEFAQTILDRLDAIDVDAFGHEDRLSYLTLQWDAEMTVEGLEHYWFTNVFTPYSSSLANLPRLFATLPLATADDVDHYIGLLEQVPGLVQQIEELARGGLEREIVISAANLPATIGIVREAIRPGGAGPFAVSDERIAELDPAEAERLREEIDRLVEERVNPRLRQLREFFEGDYMAGAPEGVGLDEIPGGDDYYRYLVRLHTTLEVTPEQVQQVGFDLVAEMEARMAEIQAEIGFAGTADEFREHLRTTPDYYPDTPEEVDRRITEAAEAFHERLDELFLVRPEAPFAAERLDPGLEGSQTYGFYNPPTANEPRGIYYFNGSDLDQRSWLPLKGIAYHELFPGHHYQISLQRENESLHELRRTLMHAAYTEGWGSYSSLLGLEAGMAPDPLSRYGVWMLEVFLATRLVVDPGMNAFDMTLEDARQYMREHTFESDTQIATETLRYSTDMPGQALAYQMGKRKLLELRARAEEALGERFDLRAFHDAVLSHGSLPMVVLEEAVQHYIDSTLAGA